MVRAYFSNSFSTQCYDLSTRLLIFPLFERHKGSNGLAGLFSHGTNFDVLNLRTSLGKYPIWIPTISLDFFHDRILIPNIHPLDLTLIFF